MELPFVLAETHDTNEHHFRIYSLDKDTSTSWMDQLADEYVKLRTRRKHVLEDLSTYDINVINPELVERYRQSA